MWIAAFGAAVFDEDREIEDFSIGNRVRLQPAVQLRVCIRFEVDEEHIVVHHLI